MGTIALTVGSALAGDGPVPNAFPGTGAWLNSAPLTSDSLRGKVVLVDFWTYSCINSLRNLPYTTAWAAKYKNAGLVVIGVHTPEFSFEKEPVNVEDAVASLGIRYPVVTDSNYEIWNAFRNEYWPADYIMDGTGTIRYHHFGEGDYAETERTLQRLLVENGAPQVADGLVPSTGTGVQAAPNFASEESPETYLGYARAERFVSPERVARDAPQRYGLPAHPRLNEWGLGGMWTVGAESTVLAAAPGTIRFRFHSRDLHMVLASPHSGATVHFTATLDGAPLGVDHGSDTTADGKGEINGPRLYQLVRQKGRVIDRTFEIEFRDPGVRTFVFTFG